MDELSGSTQDRAIFYVGATRAKLHLVVTGVPQRQPTLFDEVVMAATTLAGVSPPTSPPPLRVNATATGKESDGKQVVMPPPLPAPVPAADRKVCRHCGSGRLHAQHGQFGYFFRCIDCTDNTPMDVTCRACGKRAKVTRTGNVFHRECEACRHTELYHVNVPLGSLFE